MREVKWLLTSFVYCTRNISNQEHQELIYKEPEPLWRGVIKSRIDLKEYKVGAIKIWPNFTSSSKKISIAKMFATDHGENQEGVIFKIHLQNQNK